MNDETVQWLNRRGVPPEMVLNERSTITVKTAGRWLVEIAPMMFNFRLVLTPTANPDCYDHGWCFFGRGPDAFARAWLAALVFDPTVELEPAGYDKAATGRRLSLA